MSIAETFIARPIGTSLLTAAIAIAGIISYRLLPVSPLPQVDFPTVSVSAGLPGASPETMASAVAAPLERQFGHIAGVSEMSSTSYLGTTNITLQFDLSRDINAAARDVQAAINAARGNLPTSLPKNPTYRKVNPADAPILILSLTSDIVAQPQMYDAASSVLAQTLSQVEGVGQVTVGGSSLPAVRVELSPTIVSEYGVGIDQIRTALASANSNGPKGSITTPVGTVELRTTDQLFRAIDYLPLVVYSRNGTPVRLSELATVTDSVEDLRNNGLANGRPAVLLIISRQPGANIIETVQRVRDLLPQLQASISPAIRLDVTVDRTTTIRASIEDVEYTLLLSILLVVLVVFVFLRNGWATFIPSISVPLSLLGTAGVMYLLSYSLDNLSLMAMTVSTGFVVDDAIVVIENITRYLEQGMSPVDAARKGSKEISFTVVSISISLIAVFLPILLMGGIVGRLFREFAVTLSVAILVSMVISLTTTPMLCAVLLSDRSHTAHGRLYHFVERCFDKLNRGYATSLQSVLRHRLAALVIFLLTVGLNMYLFTVVPRGFFPQQDTGRLTGTIQARQNISFQSMREKVKAMVGIVRADPLVENVVAFNGGSGGVNSGRMFVSLKERDRDLTADEVIARLRKATSSIAGVSLFLQSVQDIRVGGRMSGAQYQFTLQSSDVAELRSWSPKVLERLRTLPLLTDVNTDQQDQGLEAHLDIDRDSASRLGVSLQAIDEALYDAFGQRQVSTMYTTLNQYHVVLEVAPELWQSPAALDNIYVRANGTTKVPLSAVASFRETNSPLAINHGGLFPSVTLSFNLAPGISLGESVTAIENAERDLGMPASIIGKFSGTAEVFQSSLANEPILIGAALLAVYIVLGILYESLIHPITILSTLPSAGTGALLALVLFSTELSVIALIGIILLIGIVKKNAIMMIDFALHAERNEGKSSEAAIYEASLLRFRPIIMTTFAALLGALPLAFGTGVGSELRRPLGLTIVGGLIVSQILTLYTTPVIYLYLDQFRARRPSLVPFATTPEAIS